MKRDTELKIIFTMIITLIIMMIVWWIDYQTKEAESLAKYWDRLEQEQIRLTNLLHNQR